MALRWCLCQHFYFFRLTAPKMAPFDFVEPHTLDEAFEFLDQDDPSVRPFGGGTALMLMMKAQFLKPQRLVSLKNLEGRFRGHEVLDSEFRVGAMTTFSELEHSAVVRQHFPAIANAMTALANVRVRNVATVGGNLAHADPHLDLPPIWMALDAEATIVGASGERQTPLSSLFLGYYETTVQSGELIAEIRLPLRPTWRTTYVKVTTRALHDWPALGLAISLNFGSDGQILDSRLVLSGALDKPTRLFETEEVLRGSFPDETSIGRVVDAATIEASIETDNRGSGDYKSHLLRVHMARAIRTLSAG